MEHYTSIDKIDPKVIFNAEEKGLCFEWLPSKTKHTIFN